MGFVDEVWERMEFRTPWSGERERVAVAEVLARFVAWHARPGARTVIAVEPELRAEVTLPDGQVVRLHGYADRLELDEDGRVVVVDLKTGKYPPTGPEVEKHSQLGLYQLAVDHGAADELRRHELRSRTGGAELVQLRHGDELPKIQHQPALPGRGRGAAPGRGAAHGGRRRGARRGVRGPSRQGTATGATSRRSAPHKASGTVLS